MPCKLYVAMVLNIHFLNSNIPFVLLIVKTSTIINSTVINKRSGNLALTDVPRRIKDIQLQLCVAKQAAQISP